MKNTPIRRNFIFAVILFTVLVLALWFGYYLLAYDSVRRSARENAEHISERLLDQISTEFAQMRSGAEIIAASTYVQDFLMAESVDDFYSKAGEVAQFLRNAAFSVTSIDNLITIDTSGTFFRFIGSLSNASCEQLQEAFYLTGSTYTVIGLDGVMFFCHSAPVYSTSSQVLDRIGTVFLLTNLNRKRSVLADNVMVGVDSVVIHNGIILLSSDDSLEGLAYTELEHLYGLVSRRDIAGTDLSVFAAVKNDVLFPNRIAFIAITLALLVTLLLAVIILYRYLSVYIVKPMSSIINNVASLDGTTHKRLPEISIIGKPAFESLVYAINNLIDRTEISTQELLMQTQKLFESELMQREMRIGLLTSQIDAHFVVNTITSIHTLSVNGDNEKAGRMAEGLAQIIKHRHMGDELRNLFVELEMVEEYMAIMNIRFDSKFHADYDVDDRLVEYLIPGLMLQPIVENALLHGLQHKEGEAKLRICGFLDNEGVIFEISDNGVGMPPQVLIDLQDSLLEVDYNSVPEPGLSGVALVNIQRRIRLWFGDEFGLSINSIPKQGTTVTIRLPTIKDS